MSVHTVEGGSSFPLNLNTQSASPLPPGIGFVPPSVPSIPSEAFDYVVSVLRLPIDLIYILMEGFKEEATLFGSIGNLLIIPADIGGALLFLSELGLLDLALLSSTVGGVTLLSAAVLIPVVSIIYLISYTLKGINGVCILMNEKSPDNQKRQAWLDIAIAISQIVLAAFILIGCLPATPMLILCLIAGLVGFCGLTHRIFFVECAS